MKFHLVQTSLVWENINANLENLAKTLAALNDGIVVLPEMFTTGFSMSSAELAQDMSGESMQWMCDIAQQQQITLCGSMIIRDKDQFYNRFVWVTPTGQIETYDKRHLFRMANEHVNYAAGKHRKVISVEGLNVMPQICYDLRFPAWSRNDSGYDVLLYVANWPASRRDHWRALLQARAIENQCYVVAVNRIGIDGNDVTYMGDSCVINYQGEFIVEMGALAGIQSVELDLQALQDYRSDFPAYLDADDIAFEDP